ncbi:hypothetical protein P43SY_006906 [Pythium insidiosum]|uniref:Syndetin C-terminal domain-containing protein n=1 Tax=Pythium insidiosum TaxID=114742 RepID=A0AAD5Q9M3_PYTIN|nr:hypothetical protein P43SY_006906 [Pythium insidiosum]
MRRSVAAAGSPVPEDAAPNTPQRRRTANAALREELAAATAAIKDQRWIKMLAEKVGRREDVADDHGSGSDGHCDDESRGEHEDASLHPSAVVHLAPSVLVPQTAEDIVSTLDPRFFTESFDATAFMLANLPSTRQEVDHFLQTEISAVDVAKDLVIARLADDVRANQDAFIQGMKQVQDVDLDLIIDLGSRILQFFDEEERMNDALQQHAFTKAVEICLSLRKDMSADDLQDVSILKKLQHRVRNFLPELRHQFDKSLRKVAGEFDPRAYRELLQAYIALAEHSESLGFEFSASSLHEVLSKIPEVVVRCIDDLTRQFIADLFGERGRALMSMDLLALQNGLDLINHVSSTRIERGYEYVSRFIKAFYLDEAELKVWVAAHKRAYSKILLANLVRNGVGNSMSKRTLRDYVQRLEEVLQT